MTDILEIKRRLNDRAAAVCEYLLPKGILQKRDWCVGSTGGEAGESLKVCVAGAKVGLWSDFAPGGESGDLIDLWRIVKGISLAETIASIREYLGIEAPKFEKAQRQWRRPEKPKCTAPRSAVLEYLTVQRRISIEAVRVYGIAEQDRTMIFPLLLPDGTLANVKYRSIDRQPGKQPKTWAEADCEPVLFGWRAIDRDAREVTICEGELDALTLYDFGYPSLSVPFGGGKGEKQRWIECEFERMAQFERIYLALDMDAEGDAAAEEIANRLGRPRCRRVKLPRKDANQCRMDGIPQADIIACFDAAESLDPPELRKAGDYLDDVIRLFWPAGDREVGYRLPFAKVADKVIFRPGEMTIWTGATTMGKSQILSHACVAFGDQGARVCIASLEMTPAQTVRRMIKQACNTDRPTEWFIREATDWLDQWLWIFSVTGKSATSRILEIFEYARARYGCDVFVIDCLMRLGVGSEDYEGQERAVYEIVSWALQHGVHIHLVAHARKGDGESSVPDNEDIKGAMEIGANAFNVISIWRNKKIEDKIKELSEKAAHGDIEAQSKIDDMADKPPVVLNVCKQRNGDWNGKIGLWFNQLTYQYRSACCRPAGIKYVPDQRAMELAAE